MMMPNEAGGANGNIIPPQQSTFEPHLPNPPMQASFRVDEGYSDETRSQSGSDSALLCLNSRSAESPLTSDAISLPSWITSLGEAGRSELAYVILRTLRTSSLATIVERLHPLLHLDPVAFLPPELTSHIFSFLDPPSLLVASVISTAWRPRALDSRLWRSLYVREGWAADTKLIRDFEDNASPPSTAKSDLVRKARMTRAAAESGGEEQRSRKRIAEDGTFLSRENSNRSSGPEAPAGNSASEWNNQHDLVEADVSPSSQNQEVSVFSPDATDTEMGNADGHASSLWQSLNDTSLESPEAPKTGEEKLIPISPANYRRVAKALASAESSAQAMLNDELQARTSLTLPSLRGERKLNWRHLYKQRRRLEENWSAGRFINFQLPHPDHPEEAHRECIYTIQYSGKYLVSGSRDKSVRIWDLDTKRLLRKPLVGHSGSVLCLQFDASEDEDIIVSGSSDTDVIVWRFSTGEQIKKIRRAHTESVLNLRFDKRYLVTCSKDKTINVWSRRLLDGSHEDFPMAAARNGGSAAMIPSHILNMAECHTLAAEGRLGNGLRPDPLKPYTLLMSLRGHNAAVNAIQVYGDQVVSASGDRTIKLWSLRTGHCDLTISGHTKGIACVQYDGRRIVSGSSDNTVKIFDRSGAEVACLLGHQYLVRTVQAGFGDQPGGEDDDLALARAAERDYFSRADPDDMAIDSAPMSGRARRAAAAKDSNRINAIGAALPPGGGGSRWGRIVSGSYDETIIIWKRDGEGNWFVGHKLQQEEAARAAGAQTSRAAGTATSNTANPANPTPVPQATAQPGQPNLAGAPAQPPLHPPGVPAPAAAPATTTAQAIQAAAMQMQQHIINAAANNPLLNNPLNLNQPILPQMLAQHQPNLLPAHAHALAALAAHPAGHHPPAQAGAAAANNGNARVFKLQFDARRIICCSQDPRIVGWDFANGDEEIVEASRFFKGLG